MTDRLKWYKKGVKDGIPICLGYFAVSFTLGIMARKNGLTAIEAMLTAALTNASAGGFAGFELIGAAAPYWQMAIMQLVVNARYLLMSCALSQKFSPQTSILHRSLVAFDVTDEIFGISIAQKGYLNPFYNYGAMTVAIPGWAVGTFLGVIMGNILPSRLVSALSVGLYGMFLAIIIPPAKQNKVVAGCVISAFVLSFAFSVLPVLKAIPSGLRVIILTVAISLFAAILFPVKEEEEYGA